MGSDPKRNAEGYLDLTAYEALKHIDEDDDIHRFHVLLHNIFHLCEIAGFQIEGRIILKDKKTGHVWR